MQGLLSALAPRWCLSSATIGGAGHLWVCPKWTPMSMGAEVTLVVSRQQVLLQKDAEIAAALEEDFLRRGVRLLKGARATSTE